MSFPDVVARLHLAQDLGVSAWTANPLLLELPDEARFVEMRRRLGLLMDRLHAGRIRKAKDFPLRKLGQQRSALLRLEFRRRLLLSGEFLGPDAVHGAPTRKSQDASACTQTIDRGPCQAFDVDARLIV